MQKPADLFKEFGWRVDNVRNGEVDTLTICYILKDGPTKSDCFNVSIDEETKVRLRNVIKWAFTQFEPPKSYELLSKKITPSYEICYINRAIVSNIFGTSEGGFRADIVIKHPTCEEKDIKFWNKDELPVEIQNLLQLVDEFVWQKTLEYIESKLNIPKKSIPRYFYEHVFIAYRSGGDGEIVAEKLAKFLNGKGIKVWYFKWEVGWGDSITEKIEEGLHNAFAAVIVFTPDFLEGSTAIEEYRALMAKKRENKQFKAGLLIVGDVKPEQIPPFMRDYFYVKISGPNDPNFEKECETIYRGILGLPLQSS